jgi:proteasome lid subunit RPN8/RPN11
LQSLTQVEVPSIVYQSMLAHSARAYPAEACGFVVADSDGAIVEAIAVANAADRLHLEQPEEFTRGSANGYVMDPMEQLRVERRVTERRLQILGTYHSHIDVGCYFSKEDIRRALMFGQPLFTLYIVTDAQRDGARIAKAYVWNPETREFRETPITIT